jgi:methionyl aminopeptidase
MTIESAQDLTSLKEIGRIVALIIQAMGKALRPGITTGELDELGGKLLKEHRAQSAPKLTYDFPGYTCISINEEAAHGIPGDRIVAAGDMVNIDVSAEKNGFFADSGHTFLVAPVNDGNRRLCHYTQLALASAMEVARADRPINLIGKRITQVARKAGYKTLKDLGSHGIGKSLHDEPEFIANFYDGRDRRILKEGQVITIEPFLSTQAQLTFMSDDGWTLMTPPGNRSAQFEHTMVITRDKPIILTAA